MNQSIPVDGKVHATPIGRCSFRYARGSSQLEMTCRSAEYVQKDVRLNDAPVAVGPFHFIDYLSASPVLESSSFVNLTSPPADSVTLTTELLAMRIRRDVDIPVQERQ